MKKAKSTIPNKNTATSRSHYTDAIASAASPDGAQLERSSSVQSLVSAGFATPRDAQHCQTTTCSQSDGCGILSTLPISTTDPLIRTVAEEIVQQVLSRAKGKFCVFLSGGIDSVLIAHILRQAGKKFTCYTAAYSDDQKEEATDLIWAKRAAQELDLDLTIIMVTDAEPIFKKVMSIIHDDHFIKVSVGAVGYACAERAAADGCTAAFTGLGAEEIFAGYQRHMDAYLRGEDVNEECKRGLAVVEANDTSRDTAILDHFGLTALCPFLDEKLIDVALNIPANRKINEAQNKIILRQAALALGVPAHFCERRKKAAQYGSKIDRAMASHAKKQGVQKHEYTAWLRGKTT